MAFGITARFSDSIPTPQLTFQESFFYAIQAAKILKWKIGEMDQNGFTAYSKFSLLSWGEVISFSIQDGSIQVKSECTGQQIFDWGKNRKNVNAFKTTLWETVQYSSFVIGEDKFPLGDFTPKTQQRGISRQVPISFKKKFSSFSSIFIPQKGYFITPLLLLINLLIFILMAIFGVNILEPEIEQLLFWGANYRPTTLSSGGWWRLISNFFIHIGIFHLLFNMYALIYIGALLEPQLGKARFLCAYLLAGLLGSVASIYWNYLTVSAGASGAIFGLYGVFIALLTTNLIEPNSRKHLLTSILLFVGFNIFIGITGQGIDNAAHIGGLLTGLLIGYAFYPSLAQPEWKKLKYDGITYVSVGFIIFSVIMLYNIPNNLDTYERAMKKFASFESMAMEIYYMPKNSTEEDLIHEIDTRSIYYWEKCLYIAQQIDKMELPYGMRAKNQKIKAYCKLRMESMEVLRNALMENADQYKEEIETYNIKIEKALEELQP